MASKHRAAPAAPFIPERPTLALLRASVRGCRACPLWERATQTVFGEGAAEASLMLVGEQPGDMEDRRGQPFVGPAGRLLDRVLDEVGIARGDVYITNVVKHFKWKPQGARRIHVKPSAREIAACRPWLDAEIATVKPSAIVCLGATAAQALLGKDFRVTAHHGELIASGPVPLMMATLHPSAILRAPDEAAREIGIARIKDDLARMAAALRA